MDVEAHVSATHREAGYRPDARGSALPRIMRILISIRPWRTLCRE